MFKIRLVDTLFLSDCPTVRCFGRKRFLVSLLCIYAVTAMIPLLAVLFTSLVLLLFVPFHLKLRGHYEEGFAGSIAVSWLWELAGLDYSKDEIRILAAGRTIFRKIRKEKLQLMTNSVSSAIDLD